ncbi:MAG: peptidoglycan-binding domain-containing protein [Bacteroidota bacterium]
MNIDRLSSSPTLVLGHYDSGKTFDKKAYLSKYHSQMAVASSYKDEQFKDEQYDKWRPFISVEGNYVETLQRFLHQSGFMPNHQPDGIFGYETLAGVRLFQEYMRTFKGKANMMPDGLAGKNTFGAMLEWQQQNLGICEWAAGTPTPEYTKWLKLLSDRKAHFLHNPSAIFSCRENYTHNTDTRKIAEWEVSSDAVHLIGIRRNQGNGYAANLRDDDFFVFLINGMAFKFFGSTAPNPKLANSHMPFLLEGQHHYHYSWHHLSDAHQVYKAWKPFSSGVLVIRETAAQESKDIINNATQMQSLLDHQPNLSINIHWSGKGSYNFSAGCQVIGGSSYVNNQGQLIDDGYLAAKNKGELHKVTDKHYSGQKTKGAYNMLIDLFLNYTPDGMNSLAYSLVREETIGQLESWPEGAIASLESQMKSKIR